MAKMKNTNTKEFRAMMFAYLADATPDDEGVLETERDKAQRIKDKFTSEYDHAYERQRTPNEQQRIAGWLAGLPLMIDYANGDIIERCEEWHGVKLDDKQAERVVSNWFHFMAMQVLKMWKHHNVTTGNKDWYAMINDPDESDLLAEFERDVAPGVIEAYGADDEPAMNEAFCNWTDMLQRDGRISETLCNAITRD